MGHAITVGDVLLASGCVTMAALAFLAFALWKVNRGDWGNNP